MPFDTGAIANYVLDLGDRDALEVSPMKLQKILYYAHGWHLALADNPLLDEQVEAWKWGPVIPSVYHQFKQFGEKAILGERAERVSVVNVGGKTRIQIRVPSLDACDGDVSHAKAITGGVWNTYRKFDAITLSQMTHRPGSPWDIVWNQQGKTRRGTDIPDELIKAHFKKLSRK